MKKVLLIAGFALCATVAFAQNPKASLKLEKTPVLQEQYSQPVAPRIDYKASIFNVAKDDEGTVLKNFQVFDDTEVITIGKLSGTDMICDTAAGASADANPYPASEWHRFTDQASLDDSTSDEYHQNIPFITRNDSIWFAWTVLTENGGSGNADGFMLIDASDCYHDEEGTPDVEYFLNSYFALAPVTIPTGTSLIDITFHQVYYQKRYDRNFVDYQDANGNWQAIEVNVTGVDLQVNGGGAQSVTVTLPEAIAAQSSLNLRFRYVCVRPAGDLGYIWIIDDVKVIAVPSVGRWKFNTPMYVDGFYGTIPQGFNIPLSFIVNVRNNGAYNLNNATLSVLHSYADANNTWSENTTVLTTNPINIPKGDATHDYHMRIDERGWQNYNYPDLSTDLGPHMLQSDPSYWPGFDTSVMNEAVVMEEGRTYGIDRTRWQYRALPTSHPGKNRAIIVADATATGAETPAMHKVLDTIYYWVSTKTGNTAAEAALGVNVEGYRWANDNGVIPSGSEFAYQFMVRNGHTYYTTSPDGGHQYQANYEVNVRFTTPDVIPTAIDPDQESETYGQQVPWVFQGMEIVPNTDLDSSQIDGVNLALKLRWWLTPGEDSPFGFYGYNGSSWYTGLSSYTVQGKSAVNPDPSMTHTGYQLPGERYNAVNIQFPDQPAILPNQNMMFGYINSEGGLFSAARQRTAYRETSDSTTSYSQVPALADWAHQVYPLDQAYTGVLADGAASGQLLWGMYWDWYPMIRMIVGPKRNLPKASVRVICEENGVDEDHMSSYYINRTGSTGQGADALCNEVDRVVVDGTYGYYVIPGYPDESNQRGTEEDTMYFSHSVIDSIIVDGVAWDLSENAVDNNPLLESGDYSVENTNHDGVDEEGQPVSNETIWEPLLERKWYRVYFQDIQNDVEHSIRAVTSWHKLGIKDIAPNVNLKLAPNPATSQVNLTVKGVSGKLNCNIIDMSGRVIYNADINGETEHIINLNGVPAGAYFVRITNDSFSKVEKLIVR